MLIANATQDQIQFIHRIGRRARQFDLANQHITHPRRCGRRPQLEFTRHPFDLYSVVEFQLMNIDVTIARKITLNALEFALHSRGSSQSHVDQFAQAHQLVQVHIDLNKIGIGAITATGVHGVSHHVQIKQHIGQARQTAVELRLQLQRCIGQR